MWKYSLCGIKAITVELGYFAARDVLLAFDFAFLGIF